MNSSRGSKSMARENGLPFYKIVNMNLIVVKQLLLYLLGPKCVNLYDVLYKSVSYV